MKTIILNGSPRKNWNTAQMLKEAQKGAESVGAETEYIDLFDLSYTGCRSCLACKRKGAERCKCFWKDDLSPVIDRVFAADALLIGSPIYLGDITSQVHGLIERLHFCALSYDDYSNYFTGKVNVGIILTMNAPKAFYNIAYKKKAKEIAQSFKGLRGSVEVYACCDTLQVADYSKYNMAGFDEAHKRAMREKQFPADLEKAFEMGARLSAGRSDIDLWGSDIDLWGSLWTGVHKLPQRSRGEVKVGEVDKLPQRSISQTTPEVDLSQRPKP